MTEFIWCENSNSPHYGRRRRSAVCRASVERGYAYPECYKCRYGGNGEIKRTVDKKKSAPVVDSPQGAYPHPCEHRRIGPSDPDRRGCILCDWPNKRSPNHKWFLCSTCVMHLQATTQKSKMKLYELLYSQGNLRGGRDLFRANWLENYLALPQELFEEVRREVNLYQSEVDYEDKTPDAGILYRGHSVKKLSTEQENLGRAEVAEEVPFYQPDQNKEALLFA